MVKHCRNKKCEVQNPQLLTEFRTEKRNRDGLHSHCKSCNRRTAREYARQHKDSRKMYAAEYNDENRERFQAYRKERYEARKEEFRSYGRKQRKSYYKEHREEIIAKGVVYTANRLKRDPAFKVMSNLRRRLNHVIRDGYKSATTVELLGCTPQELKTYLEGKFYGSITWENYGSVWHVDHVKPLALFDLLKAEEQRKACHFSNLQPLLAGENLSKGKSWKY